MDFELVTSTLLRKFEEQRIQYAVIGGFALGFWGVTRSTIDMDFLLLLDDFERAERILSEYEYRPVHKTANVAQYVSNRVPYGGIDIILAFREISKSMLQRSVIIEVSRDVKVKTLIPEDIIGLKIQAMNNDPDRSAKDFADIEALLSSRVSSNAAIDWELLTDYFELFDQTDLLNQLKEKYDQAK
jgi:hypothetical protein